MPTSPHPSYDAVPGDATDARPPLPHHQRLPEHLRLCLLLSLAVSLTVILSLTVALLLAHASQPSSNSSVLLGAFSDSISGWSSPSSPHSFSLFSSPSSSPFSYPRGRVLVVMVHSENNAGHRPNLLYFIDRAVRCWQDADYRIIVQRNDAEQLRASNQSDAWTDGLPTLPPNARYVLHENKCLDWGSVGWLLSLPPSHPDAVDARRYRYFFVLNSSVRGPMLPVWMDSTQDLQRRVQCTAEGMVDERTLVGGRMPLPWFDIFLALLDEQTKLVGPTINCEIFAHVQAYAVATDFVGLQLLWQLNGLQSEPASVTVEHDWQRWATTANLSAVPLNPNGPLACPGSYDQAVTQNEVGSSRVIVKAGYNLGSLQAFWSGADFRQQPDPCSSISRVANPTFYGSPLMFNSSDLLPLTAIDAVFLKRKDVPRYAHDRDVSFRIAWEERMHRQATENRGPLPPPLFNQSAVQQSLTRT